MGGNQSGVSADQLANLDKLDFTPATVMRPFSVQDIHLSLGLLTSVAAGVPAKVLKGVPASYGKTSIDAVDLGGRYFCYGGWGASAGSGAGVFAFAGRWYSYHLN